MRARLRLPIVVAIALAAAPAGASPEERFDEGSAAYEAGRFDEAAEALRAACNFTTNYTE